MLRGGRRKFKPVLPKRGDEQFVSWLPRDIKMGWSEKSPKGMLLMGWDLTSDTLQLWETISTGRDAQARFVGFVTQTWDGGPGL